MNNETDGPSPEEMGIKPESTGPAKETANSELMRRLEDLNKDGKQVVDVLEADPKRGLPKSIVIPATINVGSQREPSEATVVVTENGTYLDQYLINASVAEQERRDAEYSRYKSNERYSLEQKYEITWRQVLSENNPFWRTEDARRLIKDPNSGELQRNIRAYQGSNGSALSQEQFSTALAKAKQVAEKRPPIQSQNTEGFLKSI